METYIKEIEAQATWPIRHQVMWPNKPVDYVILPNDKDGKHYGLFLHDQLIAVISLFIMNQEIQFRKFATLDIYQGKGYGSQLLTYALKEALKDNCTKIWCNARTDKIHFYVKFGLEPTNISFSKDGVAYTIMEKI